MGGDRIDLQKKKFKKSKLGKKFRSKKIPEEKMREELHRGTEGENNIIYMLMIYKYQ